MENSSFREVTCKSIHDPHFHHPPPPTTTTTNSHSIHIQGAIIVGAGPSGLATAACLRVKGIPSLILERSTCIASLWQLRTYDRLRLHLPKTFCELPHLPLPPNLPFYPSKQQFVTYLEDYAGKFGVRPVFNRTVVGAAYDGGRGVWRVRAEGGKGVVAEVYLARWLVVASGENAEAVVPEMEGMLGFQGEVMHTSVYRSGKGLTGKKVLVVGCGNSGMEVCLDLCSHGARPSVVVRDTVHILPREMLGRSTFGLAMWLLKWLSVQTVDRFLLLMSRVMLGDTDQLGLKRPQLGPLELKMLTGKTPVLDVGTLAKVKSGDIKVFPAVKRLTRTQVEFVDGRSEAFDAVILATGYKSNVPSWLKEKNFFSEKDGMPRRPFPDGWKGENGLYAAGFTKRGLMGTSLDAMRIAQDIELQLKSEAKKHKGFPLHSLNIAMTS